MAQHPKSKMDESTRRKRALLGEIVPLAERADEDSATEAINFIDRCQQIKNQRNSNKKKEAQG